MHASRTPPAKGTFASTAADEAGRPWGVATSYYRMSRSLAMEAARQRLISERHQSPTRALGHANRLILRVDHWPGHPPDAIIYTIDPRARLLSEPPAEERFTLGPGDQPTADRPDEPGIGYAQRRSRRKRGMTQPPVRPTSSDTTGGRLMSGRSYPGPRSPGILDGWDFR